MTRVFVTGLGALTPIGNTVEDYWARLLAGQNGARPVEAFDPLDMPYAVACEVRDFEPALYMARKTVRRTARPTHMAVAASVMALRDSGVRITDANRERVGVLMGTGAGGIVEVIQAGMQLTVSGWKKVKPMLVPTSMSNAVSCLVSIETGAQGPVVTSTAACASGSYALLEAFHILQRDEADIAIAGGCEAALEMSIVSSFGRIGTLTQDPAPQQACKPFSADRDGFAPGEGSAALILETEASVRARGAYAYAELLGGYLTSDAYHITAPQPDGNGAARAMRETLRRTGLAPTDVDAIFAHGTGTVLNDKTECAAIHRTFGAAAPTIRVTSIKSMIGHSLGAAGAHSAVAAVKALETGSIPPTIGYSGDPEIDLNVVGNVSQQANPDVALVNAFGFGGQNAVVAFRRAPPDLRSRRAGQG